MAERPEPAEAMVALELQGQKVTITHPDKLVFPGLGVTKLDLARYYTSPGVAEAVLRGVRDRPMNLKRYPDGAEKPPFFQKRAPSNRPDFVRTALVTFPAGHTADEVVVDSPAGLAWLANLGCIDLNPWAVRAADVDRPDELRVDLDPTPGTTWDTVRQVALRVRDLLAEVKLEGFVKTSGSRGMHVYARIEPRWEFVEVRRAAVALAREVERRVPALATASWWKEERPAGTVFVDFNQNARDRSIASVYSVRPTSDARVSCALAWEELADVNPAAFTIHTVPERIARLGDPWERLDERTGSLDSLLALADRDEANGIPDAPWPPNFPKMRGEPPRVQPSKRRKLTG